MAISPTTISAGAFALKVAEEDLRVLGPLSDGYLYAFRPKKISEVMYRTPCIDWDLIEPQTATSADPAAGAQMAVVTVPSGVRWRIESVKATLVCDANVADRTICVEITDGTTVKEIITFPAYGAANGTYVVTFARMGNDNGVIKGYVSSRLPDLDLPAGWTIRMWVSGLQAGDNLTATEYTYKEGPA